MIKRREALERISLMLGGALSTQMTAGVMGQVLNEGASVEVTEAQTALLAELADVIIPTTDTPGAKAAEVEQFIIRVLRDCYELEDQETFYADLAKINEASQAAHGNGFVGLTPEQKIAVVQDATESNKTFFKQMRKFTVVGYFTSEIGATQALEYLPIPGKFEGDVPFKPGQKAWAVTKKGQTWARPVINSA
tara:strand:+ start:812 stop:1390 length:579 start_codon:yes stop_codon:yes gene_type:complete